MYALRKIRLLVTKNTLEVDFIYNNKTDKLIPSFHTCGEKYKFMEGMIICDRCKKIPRIAGIQDV